MNKRKHVDVALEAGRPWLGTKVNMLTNMGSQKKLFIVLVLMLFFSECGQQQKEDSKAIAEEKNEAKFKNNNAREKDAHFVVDVIAHTLAEIKMAELGEQKAKALGVKEMATMLKAQHTDIMNKFKSYATLKDISLPNDVTLDDKKEENDVISERDFDKEWCSEIKKLHEKSILKLEDISNKAEDSELKELAEETLPMVRLHYDKILAMKIN